jgi:hypothetical protein
VILDGWELCARLFDRGVPLDVIPLLDDLIISRVIDPPREENGRLRVRPKTAGPAPKPLARFLAKWCDGFGMARHRAEALWRLGLRA